MMSQQKDQLLNVMKVKDLSGSQSVAILVALIELFQYVIVMILVCHCNYYALLGRTRISLKYYVVKKL